MNSNIKKSNHLLRKLRLERSWTLEDVAKGLSELCERDPKTNARGEINAKMIGSWERGEHSPSLYYQEKLRLLYGKCAEELGFVEPLQVAKYLPVSSLKEAQQEPPGEVARYQTVDLLGDSSKEMPEHQLATWLTLRVSDLVTLFDEGWSLEAVLESLEIFLQGVQAMSYFSRRHLLRLGAAAAVSSIALPTSSHVSAEDRTRLCQALGDSIAAGWKLLYSVNNAQILAIAHAQLFLVQQNHALLYPGVRSICYAGVYGQIGMALHFQERDEEALRAYRSSYIAALEAGEPWYVAQSLICQADSYHALGQYGMAIEAIEEALRAIGNPGDEIMTRARAHLLTCWADNAMMLEDHRITQEKLDEAEAYLGQIVPNEEFDQASWLLLDGKYALKTGNYSKAKDSFEKALRQLPDHWVLRRAMTAIGLAMAWAHMRERQESIAIAEQLIPMVKTVDAQLTNRWFHEYLQQDLLGTFPTDDRVHKFVTATYQQIPQLANPPLLRI